MIGVIQRVNQACVKVDNQIVGEIQQGILLFLGVEQTDTEQSMQKLCHKIIGYRIFNDVSDKMNLSLKEIAGELLVVSQFTLVANTNKGMRPSFSSGATPQYAEQLYDNFINYSRSLGIQTATGRFGHDMQISLVNNGPVTFILNSN